MQEHDSWEKQTNMCLKQLKPFWKYFDKMVWAEIAVCMLSYADRSLLSICRGFKGHISRKTSGQDWIPIIHTYLIDIIPMGENKKIRIYRKSMNMFVKSLGSLVERPFICQNASPPCYIWLRSGFSPIVAQAFVVKSIGLRQRRVYSQLNNSTDGDPIWSRCDPHPGIRSVYKEALKHKVSQHNFLYYKTL